MHVNARHLKLHLNLGSNAKYNAHKQVHIPPAGAKLQPTIVQSCKYEDLQICFPLQFPCMQHCTTEVAMMQCGGPDGFKSALARGAPKKAVNSSGCELFFFPQDFLF